MGAGANPGGSSLTGNRSWRIETAKGVVLQKLYVERAGAVGRTVRDVLIALARAKTPANADSRWATERRLLARWRAAGFDVPEDRTDAFPELSGPRVTILEFVEGRSMYDLLVRPAFEEPARVSLLRRFAAEWGRRHAVAIRTADADLVQEHGSIRHVLVAGDRLVSIDLEQAFRPRANVRPLVAKEIAGYLRSHWKRVGEERFAKDLAVLVDAYPDRAILRGAAEEYLRSTSPARRILWACDRMLRRLRGARGRAKYAPLELLDVAVHRGA